MLWLTPEYLERHLQLIEDLWHLEWKLKHTAIYSACDPHPFDARCMTILQTWIEKLEQVKLTDDLYPV